MDVLRHAGLAVLWLDNQSGCKAFAAVFRMSTPAS
jgi:glucan phosphoethanolaminetransferase (alkaline phosphatase superfamily)